MVDRGHGQRDVSFVRRQVLGWPGLVGGPLDSAQRGSAQARRPVHSVRSPASAGVRETLALNLKHLPSAGFSWRPPDPDKISPRPR